MQRQRWDRESDGMSAMVEFRNVAKRYGGVTAVDDVSFALARGTLTTLLGPSGCGKTTTLRLIAGLETSSSGQILIAWSFSPTPFFRT
jgi:iron(III) transport system ATP-binding protein